jgi:RNA 2',3'-cyclic 3'-phosphodiesterase
LSGARDGLGSRGDAPPPGAIRAFVAVHLPADVRELLAATARELRGATIAVKWVERDNLHMTLAFLGAVPPGTADVAGAALERAAGTFAPFAARIEGIGAFPNLRRPRVIWAGVAAGGPELARLASSVGEELRAGGVHFDDKPFSPHVTLGRVREGVTPPGEMLRRMESARLATEPFRVEDVHLMKSQLTPAGPIYHSLRVVRLAGMGT